MSLVVMNGVPASTSTSKSLTTRASRCRSRLSRDSMSCVSPTPSTCLASLELLVIFAPIDLATDSNHIGFSPGVEGKADWVVTIERFEERGLFRKHAASRRYVLCVINIVTVHW